MDHIKTSSNNMVFKPLDWQKLGLTKTQTGYGSKIPSVYMLNHNNKQYRIYNICYSNVSTQYILINKVRTSIEFEY